MDIKQVGINRLQAKTTQQKAPLFEGNTPLASLQPKDKFTVKFGDDNSQATNQAKANEHIKAIRKMMEVTNQNNSGLNVWFEQGAMVDGKRTKNYSLANFVYGGLVTALQYDNLVQKEQEVQANVNKLKTELTKVTDPTKKEQYEKTIATFNTRLQQAKSLTIASKQSLNALLPEHYRDNLTPAVQSRLLKQNYKALLNRLNSDSNPLQDITDVRNLLEGFLTQQNELSKKTGEPPNLKPEAFSKYLREEGLSNDVSLQTKQTILLLGGLLDEAKQAQSTSGRKQIPQNPDYKKRFQEIATSGNATDMQLQGLQDVLRSGGGGGPMGGGAGQDTVQKRLRLAFYDLPWEKSPKKDINVETLKNILDEDHYGMKNVKDEIIKYFKTARHLEANGRSANGKILLLLGPPGTGKTSIGKSIAHALGRNFTRMSVAGVRDEAKIRGFESTYVNSKHGGILQGMIEAGSSNPVFMIDEVDKMSGGGPQGSPEQALHEVLDPEQNYDFRDHFISEVPVDLSETFFILTANRKEDIPDTILNRCKVIDLNKYTLEEKKEIAKRHMIPDALRRNIIPPELLNITDEGLEEIFQKHAVEPGVRELKRVLDDLASENFGRLGDNEFGELITEFNPETINEVLPEFDLKRPANSQEDFYKLLSRLDADHLLTETQYDQLDRQINKVAASGSNRLNQDDEGVKKRLQIALQELPWRPSERAITVAEAKDILNKDHTGLDNVKSALLDYVAVRQRQKRMGIKGKGKIICLSGPPGTGKTSIAKSVAEALGRDFAKIDFSNANSLSFVAGESPAIRDGKPGAFVKALSEAGSTDSVILLDEIEKAHDDRIANSLMVALDPNYNDKFHDNNLQLDIDLSNTIMIATTNDLSKLHPALANRMEIIDVDAYVPTEKEAIAKNHLIDEALRENGLNEADFPLTDDGLEMIRSRYTREGGVRQLQRGLNKIAEYIAARQEQELEVPKTLDPATVQEILGQPKVFDLGKPEKAEVGVINGLAVSGDGSSGSLLNFISTVTPQRIGGDLPGKITLQNLGNHEDLITKSSKVAFRWVQENARWRDVQVPSGYNLEVALSDDMLSIPKDGDSAGAAFVTSVMSALTNQPIRHDVAMTGTITLKGKVKAIGGVPQKLFGAHEKEMNVAFVPMQNYVEDVPYLPESQAKLIEPMTIDEFKAKFATQLANGEQIKRENDKMLVVGVEDINDILDYTLLPKVEDKYYWKNIVASDKALEAKEKAENDATTGDVQFGNKQQATRRLNLVS